MRLFIAAELSAELEEALADTAQELSQQCDGKLVSPENYHVTLAFLGEVEKPRAEVLPRLLDAVASSIPPFDVELSELGHFGPADKALIWQGFEKTHDLDALACKVRKSLQEQSIAFDQQEFIPHVTLMRKCPLAQAEGFLPYGEAGIVDSIALFSSELGPEGSAYTLLHRSYLGRLPRPSDQPMLFIDADACPVTAQALHEARVAKWPVCIAGNTTQNLLRHVRKEDPQQPCEGFWVTTMVAPIGADSADFAITQNLRQGDVLVTQDIGLAGMALGAGAAAIGVRGKLYRPETIDNALFMRHVEKKERRAGGRTQGPAAFTDEDRKRFSRNLRNLLKS